MLDPEDRHVYLQALKAPDGFQLGEAIATTYSLDLTTLLSVPVALTLPHLNPSKLGPENMLELFQALQQASSRLTVFCDQGGILAPAGEHVLYSMLERVVVEVQAPHGGAFHAKLWIMRFEPVPGTNLQPCLRLVVLSRNLTNDRCWDVSVLLDGAIRGRRRAKDALSDFIFKLPGFALRSPGEQVQERARRLAEDAARAQWELPDGFEDLQFHVLGVGKKPKEWLPESSDRLVVVSPFVRGTALQALQETTREPVALISRSDELDRIDPELLTGFEHVYVLREEAIREDGDDATLPTGRSELSGLHAKLYLAKRGWNTHVYAGSANATHAALTDGRNVEILVELIGRTSAVPGKGIDGFLADRGFRALLARYEPPEEALVEDAATVLAEEALREAVCELARANLLLSFEPRDGSSFQPTLCGGTPLSLAGVASAHAWLVSSNPSTARDVAALRTGGAALAPCAAATATCFVAFELEAEVANVRRLFVLNVPATTVPVDRDAQIVRLVLKNKEGLLRYILSLLEGSDPYVRAGLEQSALLVCAGQAASQFGAGLLEQLIRTKARHPERLGEIKHVLKKLLETPEGRELVPPELLTVWNVVSGEVLS